MLPEIPLRNLHKSLDLIVRLCTMSDCRLKSGSGSKRAKSGRAKLEVEINHVRKLRAMAGSLAAGDCPDFCVSKNGTFPFAAGHFVTGDASLRSRGDWLPPFDSVA
jgi:hypothetical protein